MSRIISLREVEKHNTAESTWIVIHNKVYDVTSYLNEHPGGEEVLLEVAGQVASDAFDDVGHSFDARELMTKYQIGELPESERIIKKKKVRSQGLTQRLLKKEILAPITIAFVTTLIIFAYVKSR